MVDGFLPPDDERKKAEEQKPPPPPLQLQPTDPTDGTLMHDGRYVQYNIFGSKFIVTSTYKPPIVTIGRGAYGIVCSAWNSETNENVALKKIVNAFCNVEDAKRTLREIKLLTYMDHENIVAIRDVIPPPEKENFEDVYIAYELMETDLFQVLHDKSPLTEEHRQYFLYQILRGLKYIHSANVVHRDLKPANILVNSHCDVKICDFGLARVISESDFLTGYVVTRWYRAPELILVSFDYTNAIDVWSVGCIFMEMVTRRPLFPGREHASQLRLILQMIGSPSEGDYDFMSISAKRYIEQLPFYPRQSFAQIFPDVDPLAIDLVEKMLTFDPRKRITVQDALAHPYLAKLHDESDEPVRDAPFSFDFEKKKLNEKEIKEMIYEISQAYNPVVEDYLV